jgi:hypothetical protein
MRAGIAYFEASRRRVLRRKKEITVFVQQRSMESDQRLPLLVIEFWLLTGLGLLRVSCLFVPAASYYLRLTVFTYLAIGRS